MTAVMPPAKALANTGFIHGQRFGIHLNQPCRRRSSRGSENRTNVVARKGGNGLIQPVEIIDACGGFEMGPGKLGHAHQADSHFFHEAGIFFPTFTGPVFRVVINSKISTHINHHAFLSTCRLCISLCNGCDAARQIPR